MKDIEEKVNKIKDEFCDVHLSAKRLRHIIENNSTHHSAEVIAQDIWPSLGYDAESALRYILEHDRAFIKIGERVSEISHLYGGVHIVDVQCLAKALIEQIVMNILLNKG